MSLLQTRQPQNGAEKRVECSRARTTRLSPRMERSTIMGSEAVEFVLCRSGPEYPKRQDCVTIPQTSERVGDLALVEVSPRAAPFLLRARPLAFALLTSMNARAKNERATPGPWMTTQTMMDSQKETRTRDFWFQGLGRRASSRQVGRAFDVCR